MKMTLPTINRWSYSRISKYQNCAASVRFRYIDKLPDEAGPEAKLGKIIHADAEDYLLGDREDLPVTMLQFEGLMEDLLEADAEPEASWYFDADWNPIEYDAKKNPEGPEDWWLITIVDALVLGEFTARVIDFKTGKERAEHQDQLELYAVSAFARYPHLEEVEWEIWYTATGAWVGDTIVREDFELLKRKWTAKANHLMSDTEYRPRPNVLCGWCTYNTNAGGPCEAGGKYEMRR